jgi:hypothetical protein
MPESSLSTVETQVETLSMRELRSRLLGFDKDGRLGNWVLRIRGLGSVYVNRNVVKRFRNIDGVLHAPDNWLASIRVNGNAWLFRVASPTYVEVPAEEVVRVIRGVLPDVVKFGGWDGESVWVEEGATYGEVTGVLGRSSHPQVGDFVYLLRVRWGNDGYTAFRITRVLGILKCTNGLIMGINEFRRVFHAKLNMPLREKINDILNRIKNTITSIRIDDTHILDKLSRTPVAPEVVERLSKRFPDFPRLYAEYKPQYGDTMMTVFQALGWIATHGSQRNSERAVSAMSRLVSLN